MQAEHREEQPVTLIQLVPAAPMPIYGLSGNPLGLTVCSFLWGYTGHELNRVGLTFVRSASRQTQSNFTITSFDAQLVRIKEADSSWFDRDAAVFREYGLSAEERTEAAITEHFEKNFMISGSLFSGEIRLWSHPQKLAAFSFEQEETLLAGSAFDLPQHELLELLDQLVPINNRPDLLAQYQAELEYNRALRQR